MIRRITAQWYLKIATVFIALSAIAFSETGKTFDVSVHMYSGLIRDIPDSLSAEYTSDGLITIQRSAYNIPGFDFSLLDRKYYYIATTQKNILDKDLSINLNTFQAGFGIVDLGNHPGFPALSVTDLYTKDIQPYFLSYRAAFDAQNLTAPATGYQSQIIVNRDMQPGRIFMLKTSENGYVALVFIGRYIGAYDRDHYYFSYSTNRSFQKNGGLVATSARPENRPIGTPKTMYQGVVHQKTFPAINLAGQKMPDASPISGCRVKPEQGTLVKISR